MLKSVIMDKLVGAAFLLILFSGQPATADSALDGALYDIGRAESQITRITPGRTSAIKRVTRMVEGARARLLTSSERASPAWVEADERLVAIENQLKSLVDQANGPAKPSSTDGLTPAVVSQLRSMDRRAHSAWTQLQSLSPADWQRPLIIKRWKTEIGGLVAEIKTIDPTDRPIVQDISKKVLFLHQFVSTATDQAKGQSTETAKIEAKFAEVERWASAIRVPHPPRKNLDQTTIKAYAAKLATISETAAGHREFLASIRGKSAKIHSSTIDSAAQRLGSGLDHSLNRARTQMIAILDKEAAQADWRVSQITEADPENEKHISNRLIGEKAEQAQIAFDTALAAIALAESFEKSAGLPVSDRSDRRKSYENTLQLLATKQRAALANVRFPQVRSTDKKLILAARKVLQNPKLKMGEILRLDVTYDVQRKNRTEGEVDRGAVTTNVTVSRYEWDEFAVTTAEKIDGKVYLYVNLFKFYHVGGSDVPVGRWVLGERRRLTPILLENVVS